MSVPPSYRCRHKNVRDRTPSLNREQIADASGGHGGRDLEASAKALCRRLERAAVAPTADQAYAVRWGAQRRNWGCQVCEQKERKSGVNSQGVGELSSSLPFQATLARGPSDQSATY